MSKPYKCSMNGCNASYSKPCRLEVHSRKHSGERPFKCTISGCSLTYTNEAHLKRHKCLAHEKCEVICEVKGCGQVLNNKYSLKKHFNRLHNVANYTFTCAECSQSFKKKWQLNQHKYLHTGEDSPFRCSICNIGFVHLNKYNKHKRNHKTYTCDCGADFPRWTLFCAHRRNSCSIKNIDHKCVICNKTFTTKTNLKQHSFIHVEESQRDVYRCPYIGCRRSYKYKKNLSYHVAVFHEKVNKDIRINCTIPGCEQILNSKKNLKQHILKVHSGLPKKKKKRKPRRDIGKSKKCMASIVSGVNLPLKDHLRIIHSTVATSSLSLEGVTPQRNATENINNKELVTENLYKVVPATEHKNQDNGIANKDVDHKQREEKTKRQKRRDTRKFKKRLASGVLRVALECLTTNNSSVASNDLSVEDVTIQNTTVNNRELETEDLIKSNSAAQCKKHNSEIMKGDIAYREREERAKRIFVKILCGTQRPLEPKNVSKEENLHLDDEMLLQYSSHVLKTVEAHLNGTSDLNSSLVC